MSLLKSQKICLSEQLEKHIFAPVLKKREIQSLRRRCENYQESPKESSEEDPEENPQRKWQNDLYRPYSQYFGFLSSLKVKSSLEELSHHGYLNIWNKKPIQIIDFGAGTLGGTLGALDFFKGTNQPIRKILAIDADDRPMKWAQNNFNPYIPSSIQKNIHLLNRLPTETSFDQTLVIAVDVLNEIGLMDEKETIDVRSSWYEMLNSWIQQSTDSTIFLFIEPAGKNINRNFLTLRNILKEKLEILLPCTHASTCPALKTNDWCHEDRLYKAPSKYWNLVHAMGFERRVLSFSMLCLGKQKNKFSTEEARVVSRKLRGKGKCEKWLCGNGKRWKASILNRHENEANESFFNAQRGDILDCHSTGLRQPD